MKEIKIGRSNDNEIVIDDNSVSRNHAIIFVSENAIMIQDNNSTNGTFINGRRIQGSSPLQTNDILKVGNMPVPWRNYVGGNPSSNSNQSTRVTPNQNQYNAGHEQAPAKEILQEPKQEKQKEPETIVKTVYVEVAKKKSGIARFFKALIILIVLLLVALFSYDFYMRNSSIGNRFNYEKQKYDVKEKKREERRERWNRFLNGK